jgi:hypothetical protein
VNSRSTDQIVADVCAALSVESVEIRRPEPDAPTQQIVRTAGFDYFGNDRLDVSPGSADPIGGWFAPSKEIARLMGCARRARNAALVTIAWGALWQDYAAEMRASYGIVPGSDAWATIPADAQHDIHAALARGIEPNPAAWDALLAMPRVALVCSCADASLCHRVVLARILEKLGARYDGEIA